MIQPAIVADYLATFLLPLQTWLARPDTTDLYVNRAGEIWVEQAGGAIERHALPELTDDWLAQLVQQMARATHQGISRAEPLLSATLPCGTRVQVVAPPATRGGHAIAFRRQVLANRTLGDLRDAAMFDGSRFGASPDDDAPLRALRASGDHAAFLAAAVARRKTIVVSGGTASGKTTLANALLREVPAHERVIAIEDSAELALSQANAVGLIAIRGRLGESQVTVDELLRAALRLRPDRILLGEIRGAEALTFLRAVNTGHPGSITTIHADTPARALDQLGMLALEAGVQIDATTLHAYIEQLVDIVVQVERTPLGRRVVEIRWQG